MKLQLTNNQTAQFLACVIMTSSSPVPTALTNWSENPGFGQGLNSACEFSATPCFALLLNKEWWDKNRLWTFYACEIGQSYTKRKCCREGCLCFGLCGPRAHQSSADTAWSRHMEKASFTPHAWVANTCRTSADTLPRQSAQKHLYSGIRQKCDIFWTTFLLLPVGFGSLKHFWG